MLAAASEKFQTVSASSSILRPALSGCPRIEKHSFPLPPVFLFQAFPSSRQRTPCCIISLYAAMVSLWISFPRVINSISVWS